MVLLSDGCLIPTSMQQCASSALIVFVHLSASQTALRNQGAYNGAQAVLAWACWMFAIFWFVFLVLGFFVTILLHLFTRFRCAPRLLACWLAGWLARATQPCTWSSNDSSSPWADLTCWPMRSNQRFVLISFGTPPHPQAGGHL